MSKDTIKPGQCWISESEPELGLGFIKEVSFQQLVVRFPSASQDRRYGRKSAPLKRVKWQTGDLVKSKDGESFRVERLEERDDLIWYIGAESEELCESDVSPKTKLLGPVGRILSGHWDMPLAFELRRQTLHYWSETLSSPVRGLLGPRVELIPHQVYVVSEVANRSLPRVLLADEVGLGKTIEAGWIMHQLLVTGRMNRVLVLAPRSMVNQWFVELHRRFNLTFRVPESEDAAEEGIEQLGEFPQLILSIEALQEESVRSELEQSSWDLIIVDEAHRIGWTAEAPSLEYLTLQKLSSGSRGLLLLTATPEQLGVEGHFGRLHLLDPQRFSSYENYLKEHERYGQIVKRADALVASKQKGSDDEVRDLIDRYGTGRVYFRNARKVVEAESYRFPKRIIRTHKIDKLESRIQWLKNILEEFSGDKFLLICSSRKVIEQLDVNFKAITRVNTALFHEKQSLIVRDRSAAYFADPQGARLLLSSEIGSEGRNFQFARHLILWDLPEDPDVLEQRIGRLDRIGQRGEFLVHVPMVSGSAEELLYRWYNEVFQIFDHPATGAANVHFQFWPVKANELDATIKKAQKEYNKKREALEQGRDRLIELNSFHPKVALKQVSVLKEAERSEELREYMEGIFSLVGVNEEDLDEEASFIEPGDSMFIPVFPGLPNDGLRITFDRRKALEREDLTLLSWDHPMVRQTMETVVTQEFGSGTLARWKDTIVALKRTALVECYFVLQCAAQTEWYADQFFPPYPIRVVVDAQGRNVTDRFSEELLTRSLSRNRVRQDEWERSGFRNVLNQLSEQATTEAQAHADKYMKSAIKRMQDYVENEIVRLAELAQKNGLVSRQEIEWWLTRQAYLEQAYAQGELRLDSIRIIF